MHVAARVRALAEKGVQRLQDMRTRVPALDAAMVTYEHDRRSGGAVLAGALAFRLFVPLLPLALLVVAALGYANAESVDASHAIAHNLGIREATLTSIASSARLSNGDLIGVVVFALFTLFTSSLSAVRALRAIHALAWDLPLGRFPKALGAAIVFIGWTALFFGLWALGAWARSTLGPAGIPVTLLLTASFFALWLAVSRALPHPPGLPWRAFLPGSILMAVGLEAIHLVTVLYIDHKAEDVSAAYGSLGIALVILLWLYLLGRLIVASAFLNATLWAQTNRR